MNALDQIEVNDYHTLRSEISRQPWLTQDERIGLIVQTAVDYAVAEAVRPMYSETELEDRCGDAAHEAKEEIIGQIESIVLKCDANDMGDSALAEKIRAWVKENT